MMLIKTFLYQEGCPIAQTLEAVIDKKFGFFESKFLFLFLFKCAFICCEIFSEKQNMKLT